PQVSPHIAQRLLCCRQFAQMIEPCIPTGSPPRVSLSVYGPDRSIRHLSRERLCRHLKGDQLTRLPEARGKLVREQQRIVAPLGGQHLHRLTRVSPWQAQLSDVPSAK